MLSANPPPSSAHSEAPPPAKPVAIPAQPETAAPSDNIFKQAWHSVEEALHLKGDAAPAVEATPPPVPEKDAKWKVKTINKAAPVKTEDPSFLEKLFHKKAAINDDDDDEEAVPIDLPADHALKHMGISEDDKDLEAKRNYFKRMSQRVKEKFDADDDDDSSDDDDSKPTKTAEQREVKKQQRKLAPKVDPKEMKEAHRAVYGDDDDDDEEDKKLFGRWWGCEPKRTKAEKAVKDKPLDKSKLTKKTAPVAAPVEKKWWHFGDTPEQKRKKEAKKASKTHEAIAAAAAYEAVKAYNRRQEKEGKKVSHGELKAMLAGMAMAEVVKLCETRGEDDDDEDDKDEMVSSAGTKALKLMELMN